MPATLEPAATCIYRLQHGRRRCRQHLWVLSRRRYQSNGTRHTTGSSSIGIIGSKMDVMRQPCTATGWLLLLLLGGVLQVVNASDEFRDYLAHWPSIDQADDKMHHVHAPNHVQLQHSLDSDMTGDHQPASGKVPVLTILAMTCFMSAMAGFGALPFFFCGKLKQSWAGLANAVACGVMLAASFDLLHEGAPYSPALTITGMVLGAVFIKNSQEYLSQFEDASFEELSGADARKAMLIVGVMAAHAFGEGSGVGVSFSGNRGWAQGTLVTIAIGLHNIPEGMAVATVMVAKGAPARKALFWSLFCAFPQALVAVPAYMFVETFQSLLPLAMGFAAGCMIWIVGAELMPDALENAPHPQVATAATLSAAWLQGLSMMIAQLEQPNGHLASPIQADMGTLLGLVIGLLPALSVQLLAAGLAATAIPSLPVALGATSSIFLGLGASGLAWQMMYGSLTWWHTLFWAKVGGMGCLLLWRNVLKPSQQIQARPSHEQPAKAVTANGKHSVDGYASITMTDAGIPAAAPNGTSHLHEDVLLAPHPSGSRDGVYMRGLKPSDQDGADMQSHMAQHAQQNGHAVVGMPPHSTAALLNGSVLNGSVQAHWHSPFAEPSGTHTRVEKAALDPHGFLHRGMHSRAATDPAGPGLDGPLSSGVWSGHSSKTVRVAAMAGLLLLVHAACSIGMHVAQAVAAQAAEAASDSMTVSAMLIHWFIPLAVQGIPMGLACVGISRVIGGAGRTPAVMTAALCAATAISVIVGCLIGTPLGQTGADLSKYDTGHWTASLQSAMAGALTACGAMYLWPTAVANKPQRARAGAVLGLGVVVVAQLLLAGLCAGTPYCVRSLLKHE